MNETDEKLQGEYGRIQRIAIGVAVVGLLACVIGVFVSREQFFRSYLFSALFWTGLSIGSLGLLMLHHLTGGGWGFPVRRLLEAAAGTLWGIAILFLPLFFGLQSLYEWAQPEAVAHDELLQHKQAYLNVPFFVARTAVYLLLWAGAAYLLTHWSRQQDDTGNESLTQRMRRLSAPGTILFAFTVSFAAIDWMMSLEPHWFSHVYGLMVGMEQILAALALSIVLLYRLRQQTQLAAVVNKDVFNDLGNLLLGALFFWAYLAFSQYLIIWSGNLPEEVIWYQHRTQGGWQWLALALMAFYFAMPFVLLFSRSLKRQIRALATIAAIIFGMHVLNTFWTIMPAFYTEGLRLHWLDLSALLGIGGVWVVLFIRQVRRAALLPRHDPRLNAIIQARQSHAHGD